MRALTPALAVALIAAGCASGAGTATPPSAEPAPTAAPTAARSAGPPSAENTTTTAVPRPAPTAAPATPTYGGESFDYRSVAVEEVVADTPLGRLTWMRASHVPGAWLDQGFPSLQDVNELDSEESAALEAAYESAPCCLSVFPDQAGGFIGVGVTGPEADAVAPGGEGAGPCPNTARVWSEVWYSPGGTAWEMRSEAAFGESGIDVCADGPWLLAHDGKALVLQFASRALPFPVVSAEEDDLPLVLTTWASADLMTWTSGSLDIGVPGMITRLTGGLGTAGGWAVFGMRVSEEPAARSESGIPLGPFAVEWAGWASSDGAAWESLDAPALFGEPPCVPDGAHLCGWIQGQDIGDALVAYLRYWDEGEFPRHDDRWVLWIGVYEEAPAG